MELITFESRAFYALLDELAKQMKKELLEESKSQSGDHPEWLTYKEAKKILPYTSKTKWQELRDSGAITFSQFGRKILYSKESLLNYIIKNKI